MGEICASTNEKFYRYRLACLNHESGEKMPLRRLPSLSALRAFEAAARRGSFKEAATELSVTPGAVSQQIKGLEADLGVALFERKVRSVRLTAAGQALQPTVSDAFLQIRQAVDGIRPEVSKVELRINATGPIISKWLLPRLHKFTARAPDIQLHIETDSDVGRGQSDGPDVIICCRRDAPSGLHCEKLHLELLIPVASPVLLTTRRIETAQDIVNAPILHDSSLSEAGLQPGWSCWSKAVGLEDQSRRQDIITFQRHAADQVVDAAAAGSGIALGRSFLVYGALADGRLTCPFGPVIESGLTYFVCCNAGRENEPPISSFLAWAKQEAAVFTTLNALRTAA